MGHKKKNSLIIGNSRYYSPMAGRRDSTILAYEGGVQETEMHTTEQILVALPPPTKVVCKSIPSNPDNTKNRERYIATHRAAVAQMIVSEEPARWQGPSEDPDAWMWSLQPAFGLNLQDLNQPFCPSRT